MEPSTGQFQLWGWIERMTEQDLDVDVRRARPSDAESIADFINRAQSREQPIEAKEVRERFGGVGFLLAERDGRTVGMLGWRAENLVAHVTDFLVWPAKERQSAGGVLLSTMEQAAKELMCEAALLFLPRGYPPEMLAFWKGFGYEPRAVSDLPRVWREAAREIDSSTERVVLKQLREDLVRSPQ